LLQILLLTAIVGGCATFVSAHPEIQLSDDETTFDIGDVPDQGIYVFGRKVNVKKRAKGVLTIGGDVTIEGRVEGDVATIGGNIIQKESGYIGGDVIVFGGSYKPESSTPLRGPESQTVIMGLFEDTIRDMAQNPIQILSPSFSLAFLAQRLVLALLWFIISMVVTTVAPGAISRGASRLQLAPLKVCAIGAAAFTAAFIVIVGGVLALPELLSLTIGAMGLMLLVLGYLYGRVTLQVSLGRQIQRRFFPKNNRSETLATLAGVLAWTLILSLPFIWPLALFAIFAVGIGLILTARTAPEWRKA